MANLHKGDNLNELWHLQNVITGIILRQSRPFTKDDILTQVDEWCEGSVYAKDGSKRNEVDVAKLIDKTMSVFFQIMAIRWNDYEKQMYELCLSFPAFNI